ncbi:phage replisome organizer N-terminal domain-containing protein [Blautia sp. HCP3S3_D9]|uniref:phage replisome organizer N-terminal domain-containing protein n=1 Tax=unclassified Blautia TaxID=2648079 RepID=UPI002A7FC156|nr:phage replisome organizer N-terminal domain-containing protein [Blautia sp.]MDY4115122.1 phage replisome organizer N-terminal domain-containing protein [Blautia sp.]
MATEKRLFWLRLKNTYFNQLVQKKMRKQENGIEMQVIYLRMMLLSLDNNGHIFYQGVYDSIEDELAEEFNEPADLIKQTIDFLIKNNMVETDKNEDGDLFIPEALECTGSECDSAGRVRKSRERKKALQCNNDVTYSNGCVTNCNSKEDKNKVREEKELDNTLFNSLTLKEGGALPPSAGAGGAHTFTLTDCQECADEGKVNLSEDGIQAFYNRMEKDGWKIKGNPIESLLKAMRGFAKNHKRYQKQAPEEKESTPKPAQKKPKVSIDDQIMEIASEYITQRLFDEHPGGHHCLIRDYCPKEAFTKKQLEYMAENWSVYPKTKQYVLKDEYWYDEEEEESITPGRIPSLADMKPKY